MDLEDLAGHRGDQLGAATRVGRGRARGAIDVRGRRDAERGAATGEVQVDRVARPHDLGPRPGASRREANGPGLVVADEADGRGGVQSEAVLGRCRGRGGSAVVVGQEGARGGRPGRVRDPARCGPVVRGPDAVQRVGAGRAVADHRLADQPAQEPQVRGQTQHDGLVERSRQPVERVCTVVPARDDLGEHRIEPAHRPRRPRRRRHRPGRPPRTAIEGARCARSPAGIRARHPRRRGGPRSRGRRSGRRPGRTPAVSPAAMRSWSATRSRPVVSSVTGCSTWSLVFISRNVNVPRSSSRNSQVPALT